MTDSDLSLLILGFAWAGLICGGDVASYRVALRWRVSDGFLGWWQAAMPGSGGCCDDHDPMECLEDLVCPWPVAGQPEPLSAAAAAELGGDVQHPEPQQLGLNDSHLASQGEQPEPGGQVGGDRHDLQPCLVDLELP